MVVQASRGRKIAPRILSVQELARLNLYRFTLDQYRRMSELEIISSKDHCELINGYVIDEPILNPPHASTSTKLLREFFGILDDNYSIRSDKPIELEALDSSPCPDLVVAQGSHNRYDYRHPQPKDIFLVIEVSDTSLRKDQTTMLELYALDKIPIYWIVNLPEKKVEVYSQPRAGKKPTYKKREEFVPGQSIPIVLNGNSVGELAVSDFLS